MTIALWICSLPLIAEFLVSPFNLRSGRTMPTFTRFTALPPDLATRVFAPLKLVGAPCWPPARPPLASLACEKRL